MIYTNLYRYIMSYDYDTVFSVYFFSDFSTHFLILSLVATASRILISVGICALWCTMWSTLACLAISRKLWITTSLHIICILVKIIFMETLKIGFSLHYQEFSCDNKRVCQLITRIVCTHTVYHDNWILVIIHFGHIIFHLHIKYTLLLSCSFGITYITYFLTILYKSWPCFV